MAGSRRGSRKNPATLSVVYVRISVNSELRNPRSLSVRVRDSLETGNTRTTYTYAHPLCEAFRRPAGRSNSFTNRIMHTSLPYLRIFFVRGCIDSNSGEKKKNEKEKEEIFRRGARNLFSNKTKTKDSCTKIVQLFQYFQHQLEHLFNKDSIRRL